LVIVVVSSALFAVEAARLTIVARAARPAILTVATILALIGFGGGGRGFTLAGLDQLFLAVLVIEVLVALAAALLVLVLEAGPALTQDAKIMVRELEIIFRLDSIARKLRVARHALIFLEQLRGIAPLAIVLPVPRLSAEVLTSLTPTAAPAAALTIIDQMSTSLRSSCIPLGPQPSRAAPKHGS
jgi:hypothetical protein